MGLEKIARLIKSKKQQARFGKKFRMNQQVSSTKKIQNRSESPNFKHYLRQKKDHLARKVSSGKIVLRHSTFSQKLAIVPCMYDKSNGHHAAYVIRLKLNFKLAERKFCVHIARSFFKFFLFFIFSQIVKNLNFRSKSGCGQPRCILI